MKGAGKSQLTKSGSSIAGRLLRGIVETACLREGDPLKLSVGRDGTIVIRPTQRKYRLQELVSKITPRNRHDETDWGWPVGKEIR
jgi:antitoxin MazE